jgi:hypothetical protein
VFSLEKKLPDMLPESFPEAAKVLKTSIITGTA